MRILEKIEISKFRSFGDLETIETFDLNIFSGSNDSGKSNLLKALNLFFTGQSDLNVRYNSESDFNKWFRDNNVRGQRIIEIKVFVAKGNYGDKKVINKGFIAKKIFRVDGGYDVFIYNRENEQIELDSLSHRKANAVINEKIRFLYIPAIRDIKFRESIQTLIQEIAKSTDKRFKSQDLKEAFDLMEIGIDNQLKSLKEYVKEKMEIDVDTNVNFSTLLESLTFETSEKIKIKKRGHDELETQKVNLRNRGDGIQMQFFSFMLWFISKYDTKHFYIWGYEEPEIAFEFKRQFEFADIFQGTFLNVAQIFVTTHSPAFAFIEGSNVTKVFRVNYEKERNPKSSRFVTRVLPINDYYEGLFRDLTNASEESKKSLERDIWGINAQKISKMIGDSLVEVIGLREISNSQLAELKNVIAAQNEQNESLKANILAIQNELGDLFPEKIFICEDEKAIKLWDNLIFDKLLIDRKKFKIIASRGCTNNDVETALLHLIKSKVSYQPTIFRQLDRDGYTNEQIIFLENARTRNANYSKFKKYKVSFLPVNEIENFSVLTDPYYTDAKLKEWEVSNKITDAFRQTTNSNIIAVQKLCKNDSEKDIFRSKEAEMLKEARTDLLKFFPGKEIKRLKKNFNAE
ncbi:MAG: AAA family ATPase, partial [Weeksellaceae bacterium]|nr:AAA family ATPase [Weeksellaceae bacterium]